MATPSPQRHLTVATSTADEATIQQLLGARTKITRRALTLKQELQQRVARERREFTEQSAQQLHGAAADFDARAIEPLATRLKALDESEAKSAALFDALRRTVEMIEARLDEIKHSPERDLLARGLERERQRLDQERLERREASEQLTEMIDRIDQDLHEIGASASTAAQAAAAAQESAASEDPSQASGSATGKEGGARRQRS